MGEPDRGWIPAMRLALARIAEDAGPAGGPGSSGGVPPDREPRREGTRAAAALPLTADVPVGAVVVDVDGHVLAAAANRREADQDATAHAEVLALRAAGRIRGSWRLTGCTLVVTLEPCTMCAGAAVLARVDRIVFGAWDPKAGAVGSLWDVVRDRRLNHRPEVVAGVLEDDCAAVLNAFFRSRR